MCIRDRHSIAPKHPYHASMCQQCARSVLSTIPPVYTKRHTPSPPYTPPGYKFPSKHCRLFITSLKSTPLQKLLTRILPHREIWPLKITEKFVFRPTLVAKCPVASNSLYHSSSLPRPRVRPIVDLCQLRGGQLRVCLLYTSRCV